MCIRNPTNVMTKQKTSERASRLNDMSTFRLPAFIHSQILTEYDLISGNDLKKPIAIMNVSTATIPIDPAPIIPATFRESLCPKIARMRKLKNGKAGIRAIIVDIRYLNFLTSKHKKKAKRTQSET